MFFVKFPPEAPSVWRTVFHYSESQTLQSEPISETICNEWITTVKKPVNNFNRLKNGIYSDKCIFNTVDFLIGLILRFSMLNLSFRQVKNP
jgi:hypothetical protein